VGDERNGLIGLSRATVKLIHYRSEHHCRHCAPQGRIHFIVPKSSRLGQVLSALRREQSVLQAQLGKVTDAIAALGGVGREYRRRQRVRQVKTVARKVRKMTAAQRKAVSARMKKYWAERRKAH
jgi:hypothetical protein